MDFTELKRAVQEAELVDVHPHDIVAIDSALPFISAFSDANGDALSYATHSLSFKRNLKHIAELCDSEKTLDAVEEHRRVSGLQAISFQAARISAILIDDGVTLDEMHGVDWLKNFAPVVGRILRIEFLAEQILNQLENLFALKTERTRGLNLIYLKLRLQQTELHKLHYCYIYKGLLKMPRVAQL